MGLASKLRRQAAIVNTLQDDKEFALLRKRRDKVNPAGVFVKKESAEFRTTIGGKQKAKGSSKQPGVCAVIARACACFLLGIAMG